MFSASGGVGGIGGVETMDTLGFSQVPARNTNVVLGDSYIVGRRIGRGAMGEVYLAQHVRLPGQFAVKLLLPELQGNQDAFARFCREAEIMSQLRHPNIVQIFDFNVAPDARPYFVMEYLQGRDLEARLQAGPLPLPAANRIVDAVASALALAHAHGVVHRDLKPANIFLSTVDGQTDELVKVLDFGISKVRAAAPQISHAVDLLGTPSYMAPEQARGQGNAIDGRTDQFALGAIAYRMLTGQEPFQGDDTAAVLYQVVYEDPPPLSLFVPPDWNAGPLQAVLDRALAKQPEHRFGGMMELARAFDDAAERTIGAAGGDAGRGNLRAEAARARRLDDADIDRPPPVRTPTPLVLGPPRRPPTPQPTPQPTPPRVLDWEVRNDAEVLRIRHARGPVLGLIALALAGTLIATGWYRKLPSVVGGARQKIHEWTRPSGAALEPAAPAAAPEAAETQSAPAAQPEPPPAAAPAQQAPDVEAPPRPQPRAAAPAPAAAPERPRAHRRSPARNHQRRAVAAPAPATPAPPASAPATPAPAAPAAAAPAPAPAAPPAPGEITPPTNPPLNGRAFEIAPPTPMERRPDLAPSDDTPVPSP